MTHTVHLHLEETDNPTLQRLCGSFDSNLDSLAKALDIHISRRFEHFTFNGAFAHMRQTRTAQTLGNGADARPKRQHHPPCRRRNPNRRCRASGKKSRTRLLFPNQARQHRRQNATAERLYPRPARPRHRIRSRKLRQVRAKPILPSPPPSMRWKNTKSNASF